MVNDMTNKKNCRGNTHERRVNIAKTLLFSLSKSKGDFVVQPFKGSGKGGQKRNKTMSCCRITHPESGTVSECQDERSYDQNKTIAFERLLAKPSFIAWHKTECCKRMGLLANIDEEVNNAMRDKNLLVEVLQDGKWVKFDPTTEELDNTPLL